MMLRAALSSLIAFTLIPTIAVQVPFGSSHSRQDEHRAIPNDIHWSLNEGPHPNATDHLVFETVYSLLQFWPNLRMRNGHNIVPGTIPSGTLLYHGTNRNGLPSSPEWVALDPEHAYNFCGDDASAVLGYSRQGCFQLTLATTRPLKVVYFDGKSASKTRSGPLDTQDLLAWGELRPENVWNEALRIHDLCAWGEKFGVDGFVRMEVSFEVMICDFASGLSAVSFSEIVAALNVTRAVFESLNSGSWHKHFPGEARIQLDLAGLVSFYDTKLVPSSIATRAGQERWEHRAGNISSEDLAAVKAHLEAALVRPSSLSSGIDWKTQLQIIVDRFSGRLALTYHLLDSLTTNPNEILESAYKTHSLLRVMLTPYLALPVMPTGPVDETDVDWSIPIFKLCAATHTKYLESKLSSMTGSERLLLQAVRGTTREICRVVTKMWAAGVYVGMDPSSNTKEFPDITQVTRMRDAWVEDLNQLMSWLDWNVWIKCNPSCGPEGICHLHRWPVTFPHGESRGLSADPDIWSTIKPAPSPDGEPKCVSLVDP